ncbi:MAG: AraC family transcriptional regulator [Cyanobacteria bacterium P01_H01_bin.21]
MAIEVLVNHPNDWLQHSNSDEVDLWHFDDTDKILKCPGSVGHGYQQRIAMRDGLEINILDYKFHDEFVRIYQARTSPSFLELEFNLKGPHAGKSLFFLHSGLTSSNSIGRYPGNQQIFKVELCLQLPILKVFLDGLLEQLPAKLQQSARQYLEKVYTPQKQQIDPIVRQASLLTYWSTITPHMQKVLRQILDCPYRGLNRQVYLEGKALELMMLRSQQIIEQLISFERQMTQPNTLEPDEIDSIYQAKELLLSNLQHPPSIADLARRVNLNRRKLIESFRQVFHMTPFEYLQDYRLQQARSMLSYPDAKVETVIAAVGYKSRSNFAVAFRKKFGLNPKLYQQKSWRVLPEKVH